MVNTKWTKEELRHAEGLAYKNWEKENGVGFEHLGTWISNPFIDPTGRFPLADINKMYALYGVENVDSFIERVSAK